MKKDKDESTLTPKQRAWLFGSPASPYYRKSKASRAHEYRMFMGGRTNSHFIPPENVDRFFHEDIDAALPGYSRSSIRGVWKGQEEPTQVLSYIGKTSEREKLRRLAQSYATKFGQESVLLTSSPIAASFETKPKPRPIRRKSR